MKKILAIILSLIFVLGAGCGDKCLTFDIGEANYINIKIGPTGEEVNIADKEFIQSITENINSLRFERASATDGKDDYAYMLTWFGAEDKQIAGIAITEENGYQISHDGYYYKVAADLNIDTDLIGEMLNIALSSSPAPNIEAISQSEVENIALSKCKVNYDYIKTEFNAKDNIWSVEFWENIAKVPTQTILIDTEGSVVTVYYAE